EIVAVDMAMASDGSVTVLCLERGGPDPDSTLVITSTDGGVTFGPPHATPATTWQVGAADATTLFAVTLGGGKNQLGRSDNAGGSWTLAATAPGTVPDGAVAPTEVVFPVDAQNGFWLPGRATIFVTHDSGRHWMAEVPG